MTKIDLTGRRFGRLVVLCEDRTPYISPAGKPTRRWICRCDCGKELSVLQNALTATKNPTTSCGCVRAEKTRSKAHDMTGRQFGRLTVIGQAELAEHRANGQRLGWLCRCDCGREIVAARKDLLSGKLLSCGCLLKEESAITVRQKVQAYDGTQLSAIKPDRPANKNNKSGIKGVYWSAREGRWIAKITIRRKSITLGRFQSIEEAAAARKEAEEKYFKPILEDAKAEKGENQL